MAVGFRGIYSNFELGFLLQQPGVTMSGEEGEVSQCQLANPRQLHVEQ